LPYKADTTGADFKARSRPIDLTRRANVAPRYASSGVAGSWPASTSLRQSARTGDGDLTCYAESGAGIIPNELGADWTPARRFPLGLRHSVPAVKLPLGLAGFSNTSTHALNLP
jgi:hypothetical protein